MTKTNEEWDKTIVALAYKIDQLNKDIETYKADRMLLEGKIKKLRTENKHLKARIGLQQAQKYYENKTTEHTSTNEVEWGEFSEILESTKTDTEL
jgi:regulator of replication initiation timing